MKTTKLSRQTWYKDTTRPYINNLYYFFEGKQKGEAGQAFERGVKFRKYCLDRGKYWNHLGSVVVPISEVNKTIQAN